MYYLLFFFLFFFDSNTTKKRCHFKMQPFLASFENNMTFVVFDMESSSHVAILYLRTSSTRHLILEISLLYFSDEIECCILLMLIFLLFRG